MPFQAWIFGGAAFFGSDAEGLQWGHAFSGMDTGFRIRRERHVHIASMGPCPFRYGYLDAPPPVHHVAVASMGPCPFRHGYKQAIWLSHAVTYTLQWGHALSGMDTKTVLAMIEQLDIASMGPCPFRHGYSNSRRRSCADNTASMGPCPFRHGYRDGSKTIELRKRLLQWGHAFSGMDISR